MRDQIQEPQVQEVQLPTQVPNGEVRAQRPEQVAPDQVVLEQREQALEPVKVLAVPREVPGTGLIA
jgi:hypothetical protein